MTQRSNSKRENRRRCGLKDDERAANCTTWRKNKETRVLAERNPAVVAVGAWVETEEREQEHPAVRAMITEELHSETRREKEENLRQFQKAVRRRVSERARMCKQQQQQQLATRGNRVDQQTSDSAQHLMTQKIAYHSWPLGASSVHSQHACSATAQGVSSVGHDKQHSNQLCKVIKQVRQRLAGCQTVHDAKELSELPGGIWKTSTRNNLVRGFQEEEEEIPLAGQHDQPLYLQSHSSKAVTFQNDLVLTRKAYFANPKADDGTEVKIQRQSQFLMHRRLFMDMEREQVKEHQLHKKQRRRIARIKTQKEQQRQEAERRMEQALQQESSRREQAERERIILERLRLEEEEEEKRRARVKKTKESTRYIEALRAQMRERLEKGKVELPPLCSCGDSFWDSHPDRCANNCVFYHNPKGYAQALHSVLLSCELNECSTGNRGFTRKFMHVLSHQS